MYIHLHAKYSLFLSDINKIEYSRQFRNILKYEILLKSVQWETSCFMRMDRRTDMTNLRNFAKVPKKIMKIFLENRYPGPPDCNIAQVIT
jgi:hypothetical protein